MAVYIDPLVRCRKSAEWPWELSCHLFADTPDELHEFAERVGLSRGWFAERVGLSRGWFQSAAGQMPHYDLTKAMRRKAIAGGAVQVTRRRAVKLWWGKLNWQRRTATV